MPSAIINWSGSKLSSSLCFVLLILIPDKMCVRRYFGFVLLVWFPGVLHALPCRAPRLKGGYLVPQHEDYSHGAELSYACDKGLKPAVEGWWARSTCINGTWSHEPQCIDDNACVPPTIPHAIYTVNMHGWYEEGQVIRIKCDEGYENKAWDATAECINGTWSSVPVCEKSVEACGEPPQIPHAIIIHQGYQEIFAVDTKLQYICEDGYTVDGADTEKSIICIAGTWTEAPVCSRESRPDTGHSGSATGGTGDSTSTGSGKQPAGNKPSTGQGGSAGSGKPEGSSSVSRPDEKETEPQITNVRNCGQHPIVSNGDVVKRNSMSLQYQCATFYKRVGPETVVCYNDGTWSKVPTCRASFCSLNTDYYPELIPAGLKYYKDGERVTLECVDLPHWWTTHYSVGWCTNGRLSLSKCCGWFERKRDAC